LHPNTANGQPIRAGKLKVGQGLGSTPPSGEAAVVMETPENGVPAQWEGEWRQAVATMIGSGAKP